MSQLCPRLRTVPVHPAHWRTTRFSGKLAKARQEARMADEIDNAGGETSEVSPPHRRSF
ncbi:hypothetical protein XMM379_000268 [Aliiroseovarius sp. xm-m-379]|nr:hypothetical protein [Aliiroseovarius sp. xm-d-517]NRP23597.1 hypothetical protein [Aliiroseovarius sp. xm-m-379]NRP29156.1 hypothetical protein [Aliiroseovarius sp. xm-m-314]NRP32396.1 hypothetical protein [Aliiroseovarius sp. xm-a-104]NRP40929.1 hypothetical protein [Aliiroseovarius sp. xm-m-339-2]NRP43881.1 hypothetical protein [Aliiroseovarius sp. xm-m-378]NRP48817.1 hypothetical protein [Aliiroseovarius sp. xm-m-354]NRP62034.1 hypothetical protein [Aliiroseovarius sp. xm-a-151]NRP64